MTFILLQLFFITSLVLADGTLSLDVNIINPDTPTVSTGQIVEYLIDFSCGSTSGDCGDLTIDFELDTELEFVEAVAPPGYTWSYNPATRTLTIVNNPSINPTFDDGEAGQVTVRARVGQNLTDYRLEAVIEGQITNGAGGGTTTLTVPGPDLTILPPSGGWSLAKSKVSPADPIGPAEGGTATYELRACPTSPLGVARLNTISFVDRFPPGAVPVAPLPAGATLTDELNALGNPAPPATPDGVVDTIRWTVDPVGSGPGGLWTTNNGCIIQTYSLQFPAATFPVSAPLNNTAYISYNTPDSYPSIGGPCPNCAASDGDGTTVQPPTANLIADKDGPGTTAIIAPGATNGTSVFIFNWNLSQANTPVNDLIVEDVFPTTFSDPNTPIINARQLSSGTWPGGYNALFQTFDGISWTTRATPDGSTNITLNAPADFPDLIRGVRLVFTDPVPPDFAPVARPSIRFIIPDGLNPADYDQDGAGPLQYRQYQNCLTFSGTVTGGTLNTPASVCEAFRVGKDNNIGFTNILTDKTSSPTEVYPLEEITFTLRLSLTQEASSDLINPLIEDILPYGMQALRVTSVSFSGNMLPGEQVLPYINIDTVIGTHPITTAPTNLQRLRFYWATNPLPGSNYDLDGPVGSETFANPTPGNSYNFTLLPDDDGAPVTGNPLSIVRPDTGVKTITIVFGAMARLDTPAGTNDGLQLIYTNNTRVVANSPNLVCQSGTPGTDTDNIDGDGNTTETICIAGGNYRIREAAQMSSQKWIRSIVGPFDFRDSTNLNNAAPNCPVFTYDTLSSAGPVGFTRYPCVAQATQGGAIEYLLRAQNNGLVNVDDYILYDVLPHEGDVGVSQATAAQQRFSQFRTFLSGPIVIENIDLPTGWAAPPTFVVDYNTVVPHNNSCRPEMSNTATISPATHWQPGCSNAWVNAATIGTAWNTVTNFRIRQTGGLIPPGAELIFSAPAIVSDQTIVSGWEAETGEIAWNSFAQRFRNAPSDRLLLTAEPRKVGVIVPEVYSIGNRVWIDNGGGTGGISGDGVLNGTEAGINGVQVQLWTRTRPNATSPYGAWTLYATDTTRADTSKAAGTGDGFYFFGNLPGGTNREYRVLIPPTQFSPGPDTTYGTADDALLATYISSNYTGADANGGAYQATQTNARLDQRDNGRNPATFAAYTNAGIGADGFPLGGVRTVEFQLTRGQTTSLATTGDQSTADNAAANVNLDNTNPDPSPPSNEGLFGRGQHYERNDYSDLTRDFGFFTPMSLGNRVWRDDGRDLSAPNSFTHANFNNGIQDGDEQGIAGVQIRLQRDINNDGDFNDAGEGNFANTTTDANGFYMFDGLPPGNYRVLILDLNFTGSAPLLNLVSSYDGDLSRLPTDNGADRNDNGIDNATPSSGGVLSLTIVLQPATEPTSELLADLSNNAAAHGPQFRGRNGELNANSDLTIDFGFLNPPMSLGNRVWIDDGRTGPGTYNPSQFDDGILNGAEQGVAGVTVNLYFASNLTTPIATTTTDANGYYLFQYLPQGDYVVEIPSSNFQATGWTGSTYDGVGPNPGPLYLHFSSTSVPTPVDATPNNNDHGIDVASPTTTPVRSPIIQLRSNSELIAEDAGNPTTNTAAGLGVFTGTGQPITDANSDLTVDFGFVRPVALGNRVWLDDDSNGQLPGDGIRQATEGGVDGVTVQLYLQGQTPGVDTPIASTVTANGGYYLFDRKGSNQADPNAARLGLGNYIVHIPAANFTGSSPLLGYINSDNGPSTNGGDTQIDSIIDGGDENGQNTLVTTTPSTYPSVTGVSSSVIQLGYDVEPLNEVDRNPTAPTFNGRDVEDGSSDLTVDFGFYRPRMSLGNRIWLDNGAGGGAFGDGIQNGTEAGIPGVIVRLYRDDVGAVGVPDTAAGAPLATTTTDGNGFYIFDGLLPGRYIAAVAPENFLPNGWTGTIYDGTGTDAGPLFEHGSSIGNYAAATVANARDDRRDNGIDNTTPANPAGYGVISHSVNLALFSEPTNEVAGDLSGNPAHGPFSIGNNAEVNINSNMTIDFGFVRYLSLGNRVWLDNGGGALTNNGVQDAGETGINGVSVQLFAADGAGNPTGPVLQTTTTAGGGYYLFDGLRPGNYVVVIPAANFQTGGALVNYNSSYDATGTRLPTDDGADRNDNGIDDNFPAVNGIRSRAVTLAYDTEPESETDLQAPSATALPGPSSRGRNNEGNVNSDLTLDFGFVEPRYSLGNYVWYDYNNNGLYDTGFGDFRDEQPAPGVTVRLYRSSGNDANGRGVPTTALSSPVRTTTTDAYGYYLFDDLPAGDYVIWIDALNFRSGPPAGPLFEYRSSTGVYSAPTINNARLDTRDNGVDEANPVVSGVYSTTISITKNALPIGETALSNNNAHGPAGERRGNFGQLDSDSDLTRDFGFYKPMSIGNRVWLDTNNNGIVDTGENGIANVRVELWEDTNLDGTYDTFVGFRNTSPTGHYLFDNLLPGNYIVVIPASNFTSGSPLDGLNSSNYTDVDAAGGAYVAPTTAGRLDNRDNGQPDNTAQFPGDVVSSEVQLRFDIEPTGETDLTSGLGVNGETNRNSNLTIDFGFVGDLLSLGNRVWLDPNNNGVQDAGENGIANVRVSLYRDVDANGIPDGPAIGTTTTDASGHYLFDNLPPGRYIVGLDNANFGASQPLNGLISSTGSYNAAPVGNARDDRRDNGIDTLNPTFGLLSHMVELARGAEPTGETDIGAQGTGAGGQDNSSNLTIDFGLFRPLSLGNRIWLDNGGGALTNNGLQDVGEPGLGGVTTLLYRYTGTAATPPSYTTNPGDYTPVLDALGNPRSSTTDANGYYLFDGLGQGTYAVVVAPTNFQAGGPLENFDNSTPTFATPADRNDNGINNPTPADNATNGIASNPVTLTLGGAPTGETDLSGNTAAHGPNSRGRNGEADNNSNLTIDFGFIPTATLSLGNRVWIDEGAGANARNGMLDVDEVGAANVRVSLYFDSNNDGIPDGSPIASTTTDANGYYLFDNLAPGRYIVGLDASNFNGTGPLVGYGSSPGAYSNPTVGNNRDDNRDNGIDNPSPNLGTGLLSHSIQLTLGNQPTNEAAGNIGPQGTGANGVNANSNLTIDFSLYRPLSIGNRVWFDNGPGAQTNNGLQDAGEPGIANVFVELYAANPATGQRTGAAIATTLTDAGGYYLFDGLLPGEYVVYIPLVNFNGTGALVGLTNSEPTNPDALTGEQATDRNDNGINDADPATNGIASNRIALAYGSMPTNETDLSGNAPDHGPNFRGRNGEANNNSNLTVDFGFFLNNGVRMSLGNRVWLDNGAGGGTANDGFQNGTEPGVNGVAVQLFADANGDGIPDGATPLATTTTTGGGYYLFDNLLPGRYVVFIPPSNFASGGALYGTLSSTGAYTTPAVGTRDDRRDNGVDATNPAVGGVRSGTIQLVVGNETIGETDIGPQGTGLDANGQPILDANSNLTIDFSFTVRYEWGDAPDTGAAFTFTNGNPANYGTSSANGGPSHVIVSNLYLGNRVDPENDGQPNATADGDDVNGTPDDEDGVRFPPLVPGLPANVEITVFNNTGQPATLVGWIDFDGSGTFEPGEGVSITVPSSPSPQIVNLTFNVPIGSDLSTDGTSFARFRLSTDPSLTINTPGGPASNGEVEDYRVTINPPGVYIQKTDGRNAVVVGQSTTYTITIRNSPSAAPISGRPFRDDLDTRFTNVSWTCVANALASCINGQGFGTGANGAGNVALSLDLAPGGEIIISISATLRADVIPPPDAIINIADFSPDGAEDVNGIIFDPPFGRKTGIHLGGNIIRWTMVWFNTGLAQPATITDTLPTNQTFAGNLRCVAFGNPPGQSVTTGCDFNPATRQVIWTGTIDQGNANRIEITFDVAVPGDGNYNNVATLTSGNNQQATAAAAVVIGNPDESPPPPTDTPPGIILVDPAIVKLVNPRLALPGETITWTITITNPNAVAVDNVILSDAMPVEFIIDSISASRGTVTRSGQQITVTIGVMQPAEQVTVVIQTRLNPRAIVTSSVTNIASLEAPFYDPQNARASATVEIISRLPETGETPQWRDGLLLLLGLSLAALSLGAAWRVRTR